MQYFCLDIMIQHIAFLLMWWNAGHRKIRFEKMLLSYNMRSQILNMLFHILPLQTHISIILMIQTAPKPDTTSLKQIVKKNRFARLNITDFKIINGFRIYKVEWVQSADNQQKFKWETLEALQPFIDDVLKYEQRNQDKIRQLEIEWEQYFYDGQVNKPLQYFNLRKVVSDSQGISNDDDSQFKIGKKRKKKINNKQKSIRKCNKNKKKRHVNKRTQNLKIPKNKMNQKQPVETTKQNEAQKLLKNKVIQEMSLQSELQKYILDWKLQIPYVELTSHDPSQIPQSNRVNQMNHQTPKKETECLPPTLHKKQSKSNYQQNNQDEENEENEESEQSHHYSYKLFTSEQQEDDSNNSQSYEEVEYEQFQYEKPQNMRQFIKQQMIALNIESPSELLYRIPKLKIQDNISDKSSIQNQERRQQFSEHFSVKNNIKKEKQIVVKQQEKVFSLVELFQKIDSMNTSERIKTRKDKNNQYIYENILSADKFWCSPLPPITSINRLISYGSLTFYSVNMRTSTSQIQKFVLPELITKYYPQIQQRFYYDC